MIKIIGIILFSLLCGCSTRSATLQCKNVGGEYPNSFICVGPHGEWVGEIDLAQGAREYVDIEVKFVGDWIMYRKAKNRD
jgi:hypothetical protein